MKLITIKKSHVDLELQLIKNKLEAEGIACFLKHQFTSQLLSFISSFAVELQVSSTDVKRALEIIAQMEESSKPTS